MQILRKIMKFKDLIQTAGLLLLVLLFVLEIKKKALKMTSQLVIFDWSFSELFFFITLNLKNNSSKSSNKNFWAKYGPHCEKN